ncbi:MAG: hypothetical protein WBB45_03685 [Cyclobacteriaceae bacterium]
MKYIAALIFILTVGQTSYCQTVQFGAGFTLAEREYYPAVARIDSVVAFRRDYYGGGTITPFVRLIAPVYNHFSVSAGLTYFRNAAGLSAYKEIGQNSQSATKVTVAGIRSLETPVLLHYSFFPDGDLTVKLFAGIIPVFSKIDFEPRFKAGNSLNWPQEVVDVMNKAGTLPKRFYMDYQYGGNITYKRFGLDVFIQQNLTKNINNNLEVYGQSTLFTRKTESLRFLLSYSIPLFQN